MASRAIEKLTAVKVDKAKQPGMLADGGGLYLQITAAKDGAVNRSWLFRYWVPEHDPVTGEFVRDPVTGKVRGRNREAGLGPLRDVSLAEARVKARKYRNLRSEGIDPIEARGAERAQKRLDGAKAVTFKQVAEEYIQSHEAGWSAVHQRQWRNTLAQHVYPVLGGLPIGAIDTALVLRAIKPLWKSAPETASRVRGRLERVLDAAKAQELRTGENPARWRGHLDTQLPPRAKVLAVRHHPAMDYNKLPGFIVELHKQDGIVARLVELIVLTATRLGEPTGAKWEEFDLDRAVWTIPAARMKSGKEHRIPLSRCAIELLQGLPRASALVFPHPEHPDRTIHHNDPTRLLRRLGHSEAVHGFRSSFRDWCADRTSFPADVAEAALAHKIGDKVRRAYQRGDMFEQRRRLMQMWSEHCTTPPIEGTSEVIPLRAAASSAS